MCIAICLSKLFFACREFGISSTEYLACWCQLVFQAFLGFDGPMKSPCILRQSFSIFFCHGVDDDETARQPRRYIEPSTPNVHWRSVRVGSIESRTFVLDLVSLSTYYEVPMQRQWLKKNATRDNLLVYTIQFPTIVCSDPCCSLKASYVTI